MNCRELTIEPLIIPSTLYNRTKIYSKLRIKGKWFKNAGFNPGDKVLIKITDNSIIIERRGK